MLARIKMPKVAETTDTVLIEEWLVAIGDQVAVDQALASVETDKVTVELPSPVDGRIVELLIDAGEEVRTGEQICVIET